MAEGVLVDALDYVLVDQDGNVIYDDECCCYDPPYGYCQPCCTKLVGGVVPSEYIEGVEVFDRTRRIFTNGCLIVEVSGLNPLTGLICQGDEIVITATWNCAYPEDAFNDARILWDNMWCLAAYNPDAGPLSTLFHRFGLRWPDAEEFVFQVALTYNSCENTGGLVQAGDISVIINEVGILLEFEDCPKDITELCCEYDIVCRPCCNYHYLPGGEGRVIQCGEFRFTEYIVYLGEFALVIRTPDAGSVVYCDTEGGEIVIAATLFHLTDPEFEFVEPEICLDRQGWFFAGELPTAPECTQPPTEKCIDGRSASFSLVGLSCEEECYTGAPDTVVVRVTFKDENDVIWEIGTEVLYTERCPNPNNVPCCCEDLPLPCCEGDCFFPVGGNPVDYDADKPYDIYFEEGGPTEITDMQFRWDNGTDFLEVTQTGPSKHAIYQFNEAMPGCPERLKWVSRCCFQVPVEVTSTNIVGLLVTNFLITVTPPDVECYPDFAGNTSANCPPGGGKEAIDFWRTDYHPLGPAVIGGVSDLEDCNGTANVDADSTGCSNLNDDPDFNLVCTGSFVITGARPKQPDDNCEEA